MSEHVGKFGIKRGLLKDEFTIIRIERETEQYFIGPLLDTYAGKKRFVGRARRNQKADVLAIVDTLEEAEHRIRRTKETFASFNNRVDTARSALIQAETERDRATREVIEGTRSQPSCEPQPRDDVTCTRMPVMPEPDGKKPGDEDVPGSKQTGEHICPVCGGTGKLDQEPCPDCGGSGQITVIVGDA
jgi:hypothetical protein